MLPQIIFYIAFYIIGVVLGSFFTLATYRIPLKQDILYTRSYCPKCNNKLKSLDLIPILSYIFLGGKCRYCHDRISPRYIIIEFFSGLFYLLFVVSLKINIFNIEIFKIIKLIYGTLIISSFFIIGGIAKEHKIISKGTVIFGLIVSALYMIYLYIVQSNIYRYIIYFVVILMLFIFGKSIKNEKYKKYCNILILLLFSIISTNEIIFIVSSIFTMLIHLFLHVMNKKKYTNWIFYFSFLNILVMIVYNFMMTV